MSRETDKLAQALRDARPSDAARTRGIDAAMAAFETEFGAEAAQGKSEKSSPPSQGSDSGRRLKGQNAPGGGARPRRRRMTSRASKLSMMMGGTGLAAVIAAFVVVKNADDVLAPQAPIIAERAAEIVEAEPEILAMEEAAPVVDALTVESDDAISGLADMAAAPPPPPPPSAAMPSAGPGAGAAVLAEPMAQFAPSPAQEARRAQSAAKAAQPLGGIMNMYSGAPADTEAPLARESGRDRFESFEANPVKRTADDPVSTFSVDVDTASYAFLRASLNNGAIPPADAIRVEELINYFPYDYEAPEDPSEPFRTHVTVTPTPWNAETKLLHIGIKGYVPPAAERPQSNIVLLIDTSGSMEAPNKLPLLINSFNLLLDTLDEDDTVAIVTYAGSAGTVLEPTPASDRAKIAAALGRLGAGGSTAGAAGLRLAYETAQESFAEDGINRVILATDGDFNVGFSSPAEMEDFIERKRETGIFLSVLGFGMGNYNDHLMQALAQNGNGVAAYIDTLSEARKVLADEAGSALVPIAQDVKIQVEFNPATISEYRLIGYETRALSRADFNDDAVDAGEINSGHTVTAIYEITPKGSPAELIDAPRYARAETGTEDATESEYAFVKIRYKRPGEDESTLLTRPVAASEALDTLNAAPADTRFAAAVAGFGQLLRGNPRVSGYGYDDVIALAAAAKGADAFGYRSEFVNLVRLAKSLHARR